jgi:SP family general alpha glucoside:H+ symporter-like MFS transporter
MTIAIPYMINPDQANLRGKLGKSGIPLNIVSVVWLTCSLGFFFGGLAALCLIWSYLRVPETKDRTYAELDLMFERKVRTREFKNYKFE